jgi:filamentous hemagglutinin family protein
LNRAYRLVWSRANNAWVVASEITKGRGKSSGKSLAAAALMLIPIVGHASPIGGQVVSGIGTIAQSGNLTTINQGSQNLSVNWKSFNVGSNETVNFLQPSASAIAVNRIYDTNGSQILGHLNANGQVWLINPNGILFGKSAQVNVGGLVASTLDSIQQNGSSVSFSGKGAGRIINEGTINGHYVALIGNTVSNTGMITANLGTAALGAGSSVSLTFSGNDLVHMQVDRGVLNALVSNGGIVQADGGYLILSAGAKDELLASVVNNTGIVRAQTVQDKAGVITLLGGMKSGTVNVSGTIDASAPNGGNGGKIETSGAHVKVSNDAKITTLAQNGLNGSWLIDPVDFTIAASGGDMTGAAVTSALAGGNFTILSSSGGTSGSGNINVDDTVSWSANTLTLNAQNNININANLNGSGTASLALQYGQGAVNAGNASTYNVNAAVNLEAGANFSTKLGSDGAVVNYTVITLLGTSSSSNDGTLQGMGGNLSGNYALGANIDASITSGWNTGAGFFPVGNSTTKFTGIFAGLGHTISNLTINYPSISYVGLFGYSTGTLRDVGLINGSITGLMVVGSLAGRSDGAVSYSYASGGSVTVDQNIAGGLIGQTGGAVSYSYASASVKGLSNGTSSTAIGGLLGSVVSGGSLSNSYAAGSVSGGTDVGGLVGQIGSSTVTISDSYSTGAVSGGSHVGGLVGNNSAGTINNCYWDSSINAVGIGVSTGWATGGIGLTTTQMQTQTNFTSATTANLNVNPNWDFANTWVMYDGYTYPLLRSFMTPLTVTANSASKTYNGIAFGGGTVSYSVTPNSNLLGTVSYGGTSQGAVNAGSYVITPSGLYSNQQGYIISYVSGSLTMNPAPLTVSGLSGTNRTYNGSLVDALSGTAALNGLQNGETLALGNTTTGTLTSANAGSEAVTTNITISNGTGLASNYTLAQPTLGNVTISPAPLTVSGLSGTNRTYNGSTADSLIGTAALNGLVNGETLNLGNTTSGTLASANAGSEAVTTNITISNGTGLASNYTLAQPTLANVTISPAPLTVTGLSGTNRTYNGSAADSLSGTAILNGLQNGETLNLGNTTTGTLASANAGSEAISTNITISNGTGLASNYTLTQPALANVTITPATLTYAAAPFNTMVGEPLAGLTGSVTGFVGSDSQANSTTGNLAWSTTATSSSQPGQYDIEGSGLSAANYVFVEAQGNATALTLKAGTPPEEVTSIITQNDSNFTHLASQPLDLNPSTTITPANSQSTSGSGSGESPFVNVATQLIAGTGSLHIVNGGVNTGNNQGNQ